MINKYIKEYVKQIKAKGMQIDDIEKYKDIFDYFYMFSFIEFNFRYLRYFYIDENLKNKIRQTAIFSDLDVLLNYEKSQTSDFFGNFRIFELSFKTTLIDFILSLPAKQIKQLQFDIPKVLAKPESEVKPWSNNFSEFYNTSLGDLDFCFQAFNEIQKNKFLKEIFNGKVSWDIFEIIFSAFRESRNLLAHNDSFIGKPLPIFKPSINTQNFMNYVKTKKIFVNQEGKIHIGTALKLIDLIQLKNKIHFFNKFSLNFQNVFFQESDLKNIIMKDIF